MIFNHYNHCRVELTSIDITNDWKPSEIIFGHSTDLQRTTVCKQFIESLQIFCRNFCIKNYRKWIRMAKNMKRCACKKGHMEQLTHFMSDRIFGIISNSLILHLIPN